MTDEQNMLGAMVGDLFADIKPDATIATDWASVEAVELPGLLVAQEHGGFGGTWEDAVMVFRLAGFHVVALPVVEAIIARAVSGRTDGRGTIASSVAGEFISGCFTGRVSGICHGEGAAYVVAPAPSGRGSLVLDLDAGALTAGANIAGEPRAVADFEGAPALAIDADVFAVGALARVAQIAGALDAALARSVNYANERVQFGKPLGKFQAVQQTLATFACEAAAANCAAMGVAQAMGKGNAAFEIAASKLRANRAVGVGTALAHQVHGGIGFTHEYPLHPITRRLWAWRSEFGNDAHWSAIMGDRIIARGAESFWPDLTALTD